ncbi:MAG TPA: HAMP domain-containing sensor histidine kinase [Chroococcales cyanobacterium]
MKDEFLSLISHELRTPVNAIVGFGSLLDDEVAGTLNEQQHQYLGKVLRSSERMLALINDLLDAARIKAGKFSISPSETDYPELIKEVVVGLKPLASEKSIGIEVDINVPFAVFLDRQRIFQVISNLLSNAIKFTPPNGRIRIKAAVEGDHLITEIEDNGIGIAPEDLPKLFIPVKKPALSGLLWPA